MVGGAAAEAQTVAGVWTIWAPHKVGGTSWVSVVDSGDSFGDS